MKKLGILFLLFISLVPVAWGASCNPGYRSSGGSCIECEAGYKCNGGQTRYACYGGEYQPNTGQSSCLKCPTGQYTSNSVASGPYTSCRTCAAGTYNTGTGNATCKNCEAGYYCTGGAKHAKCPAGTYSAATNATNASACTVCADGKISTAGSSSCTSCPTGQTSNAGHTACVDKCTGSVVYDSQTDSCVAKCTGSVQYNEQTGECEDKCTGSVQYNEQTGECEERCSGSTRYDAQTGACVPRCTSSQFYNEQYGTCEQKQEIPLKKFTLSGLENTGDTFKIDIQRNHPKYPYHLVIEMQEGNQIKRYCTGDESCKIVSQGKVCEENNWVDWCYKE